MKNAVSFQHITHMFSNNHQIQCMGFFRKSVHVSENDNKQQSHTAGYIYWKLCFCLRHKTCMLFGGDIRGDLQLCFCLVDATIYKQ